MITNSPVNLNGAKIIDFEVNENANNDSLFIDELKRFVFKENDPDWLKDIIAIDFSSQLKGDKYFALDDHITAEGHIIIADKLIEILM